VADLPTFYFLPAEKRVRVANCILREVAARHGLAVVPLHAAMKRQGVWGVTTQFAGDLFHPNDRGYRVWSSAFLDAVDARLQS
jgi:lysophospholipase L1-like esterase